MALTLTTLQATAIPFIILTSVVFAARMLLCGQRQRQARQVGWDDGWLVAGYVFFLAVSALYLVVGPTMFRLEALQEGRIAAYAGVAEDALFLQKIFFATTSGLWLSLWSVKFSLLALYRKLMAGLARYIRLWWVVVMVCVLALAGSITSSMLSCSSMRAWFTAGACGTPRDVAAATVSLWYSFAVDVLTDILVMTLPLGLIRNLQIPMLRKCSIAGLFCLGWICVAVSVVRVVQLGKSSANGQPSAPWLALWGIVEASIAVIIGCGPGLYRKAKSVSKSRQKYYDQNRGYVRAGSSLQGRTPPSAAATAAAGTAASADEQSVQLAAYPRPPPPPPPPLPPPKRADDNNHNDDDVVAVVGPAAGHATSSSSQDELVGVPDRQDRILVTRSVTISGWGKPC